MSRDQNDEMIGEIEQIYVHNPGDLDGPLLRIEGTVGSVCCVAADESIVDHLTETAAEIQTVFDELAMLEDYER